MRSGEKLTNINIAAHFIKSNKKKLNLRHYEHEKQFRSDHLSLSSLCTVGNRYQLVASPM